MKRILILFCFLLTLQVFAQYEEYYLTQYNISRPKKEFFATTNSGVLNTPLGIKIGFIYKPGFYLGMRSGMGQVYHSDSDFATTSTYIFSITAGMTLPIFVKGDFKIVGQFGTGYGQWWKYRWERWTRSGVELESGFLIQKRNLLLNVTGNVLNGPRTYPTGDISVGIGFVCGCNCK